MLLALEPKAHHTVDVVAERYRISRNHMNKVAQTLVQGGFIESARGRGGGIRLARPANDINLGDVVRATEENFHLVECFSGSANTCIVSPVCGLRGPLREAVAAFFEVLDRYSLGELIAQPGAWRGMRRLLSA
jgi:Rrf2 family nitric oxide-sensitive transcriptional repressor